MKVTGIIAEFNPFHRGHEYFIKETLKETGADHIIAVLSGDFTQRGIPGLCDRHLRTLMALRGGVDAVIELPVMASCASAEFFASSGVFLLNASGIVTDISFGVEYGKPEDLSGIAGVLLAEPEEYRLVLKEGLRKGLSYPLARSQALKEVLPSVPKLSDILNSPNDILAIEYLKALKRLDSPITPHPLKRYGAEYNDEKIRSVNSSALAIRKAVEKDGDLSSVKDQVPGYVFDLLSEQFNITLPIFPRDFSALTLYSLLRACHSEGTLTGYADISESLSDRIIKKLPDYSDLEGFTGAIKTRDMTYSRILRCLMHVLLDMKKPEEALNESNSFIRILGFKETASPLIKEMRKRSPIPVISRLSDGPKLLSGKALKTFEQDLFASELYRTVIFNKFGTRLSSELSRRMTGNGGIFTLSPGL